MSKVVGRAEIRINGQFYDTQDGATLQPGGIKNTDRMGMHSFHHNETLMPSVLTCSVPVTAGLSVMNLQQMSGAEITFTADTGQTYILRGACQTGDAQIVAGAQGGFISCEFKGQPAEEVLS